MPYSYYKAHPDRAKEAHRRWARAHPDRVSAHTRDYIARMQNDPVNRAKSYAIDNYIRINGLKSRGLANLLGESEAQVSRWRAAQVRIPVERFSAVPELYWELKLIEEESQ